MSEIFCNEKVNDEYKIFICTNEEKNDMLATIREYYSFGYDKVTEFSDKNNYIVIVRK